MRRCRYRILILFPEDYDYKEVAELVLELGNYFSLDCVRAKAYKPRGKHILRLYLNGSLIAQAKSARGLRARFWSAWHAAKKMGVKL